MIFDYDLKNQEVEKLRVELTQLKETLKTINKQVRSSERLTQSYHDINHSAGAMQKRSKSTINILHQEGDFEEGLEDECVDPMIIRSNTKVHEGNTVDGGETQSRKLMRIASESPMVGGRGSDIKKSFRDVASYLTPNKSSSK